MGNVCCSEKKKKKRIILLLVGLDNAGKTVAVKGLAGESINDVVPTVGFHTVRLRCNGFIADVYDLGGTASFRGIWPKYFVDAYGIIFVIDSSDFERLDEAKQVLESVLSHEKVAGKPLLFLANKQDSKNALDEIDLHEKFNLEELVNTYQCPTLVECCAATDSKMKGKLDPGIKRGFNWLMSYIEKNYDELYTRVIVDMRQQEQIEKKVRDNIIKRLQETNQLMKREDEDAIELYSEYTKKINSERNYNHNGNCVKESEDEFNDFPPIYYGSVENHQPERPKSARDFVRDQLLLNCNSSPSKKKNKTAPINLIHCGRSHSAKVTSQLSIISRRSLKSASDIDTLAHLPNMVFPSQQDESSDVQIFSKTCRFLPLDSPKIKVQNGIAWSSSEDNNKLSFIQLS